MGLYENRKSCIISGATNTYTGQLFIIRLPNLAKYNVIPPHIGPHQEPLSAQTHREALVFYFTI